MTSRDCIEAQSRGSLKQKVELNVAVALDAGVGRAAGQVALDKRCHHVALELLGVVKDVVINAQYLGYAASVVDVSHRTASRVGGTTPEFECGTHHLMALFDQESGSYRGVDSPTHRDENLHASTMPIARPAWTLREVEKRPRTECRSTDRHPPMWFRRPWKSGASRATAQK